MKLRAPGAGHGAQNVAPQVLGLSNRPVSGRGGFGGLLPARSQVRCPGRLFKRGYGIGPAKRQRVSEVLVLVGVVSVACVVGVECEEFRVTCDWVSGVAESICSTEDQPSPRGPP